MQLFMQKLSEEMSKIKVYIHMASYFDNPSNNEQQLKQITSKMYLVFILLKIMSISKPTFSIFAMSMAVQKHSNS